MKVTLDNITVEGEHPARDLYRTLYAARLNSMGRLEEDGTLVEAPLTLCLEWAA